MHNESQQVLYRIQAYVYVENFEREIERVTREVYAYQHVER